MTWRFDTRVVHFRQKGLERETPKAPPIYQTSAFAFSDLDELEAYFAGERQYLYTRFRNPNADDFARGVAALEGGEDGVAAASGMAAILAATLAVVKPGERILCPEEVYGGTYHLFTHELARLGIGVDFAPANDVDAFARAFTPETRLVFLETISNPLLRVPPLKELAALARERGAVVVVDNTFATPYLARPLEWGAHLVVHSATKFLAGHSDVTAGVVVGERHLVKRAREIIAAYGCHLNPFEAWLAARGLKTLSVRMARHCENAMRMARWLAARPAVARVYYPGLSEDDGERVRTLLGGRGGALVTFRLREGTDVGAFFRGLSWIKLVPTLAGVETTVAHPASTSHRALPPARRRAVGVTDEVVRLSVGLEDPADICDDLARGLAAAEGQTGAIAQSD
ncbi:trans-sulfuration enzyme family protein [Calditerricola satsumensis]|uniref:homocysteine desulfhydrase n=1 Tax=Calditerricola satsumensis TaxID=373054 RepID=A0A8J3BGM8_9BACI|nr:aminotransferase class I/II-fold pyridoxal phosphate-dependent enzyme [Calditerricola satsumensis]GGK06417.1 methionine gamma-lyase [Calditerricola satsumensis]